MTTLFAAKFPITLLLSLGVCLALLLQDIRAQDGDYLTTRKICDCGAGCVSVDETLEIEYLRGCPRRTTLTGDWRGIRSEFEDHGIEFNATVTQFFQGVASGGRDRRFRYGGHGDYDMSIDFGKLCRWDGLSLELGAEHRFGANANGDSGSVIPVALLPSLPDPETDHVALTNVVLTHELSDRVEVFFGKLDTLEYDANAFADGKGRDRFFSTAFIPCGSTADVGNQVGAQVLQHDRVVSFFIDLLDTPWLLAASYKRTAAGSHRHVKDCQPFPTLC